ATGAGSGGGNARGAYERRQRRRRRRQGRTAVPHSGCGRTVRGTDAGRRTYPWTDGRTGRDGAGARAGGATAATQERRREAAQGGSEERRPKEGRRAPGQRRQGAQGLGP